MLESENHGSRGERAAIATALSEVMLARGLLSAARRRGDRQGLTLLRDQFVMSLEKYATIVEQAGAPLPPKLRDELQLYRSLGGRP